MVSGRCARVHEQRASNRKDFVSQNTYTEFSLGSFPYNISFLDVFPKLPELKNQLWKFPAKNPAENLFRMEVNAGMEPY